MKILHIITKSELGGAQSVLTSIVNALCAEHEVTVIAGEGDGKMFDAIDDRVRKIHYPHLQRAVSLYHDTKALFYLWKLNRKLRPDIIHLHSSKAGLLGRLVFPKQKIVYTIHGFDSIRVVYRRFLPIERIMQRRCAAIFGPAKNLLQRLVEKFLDSDGYIIAAPVFSLTPSSLLVTFRDRVFGPKMDVASAELGMPEPEFVKGRYKARPGGLISVGGALTEHWTSLGIPTLYTTTFSAQTEIVDHMNVFGVAASV